MRTFTLSPKFKGCFRVEDYQEGGAVVITPFGKVVISGDGRVNWMECWHLVADAARALGWRRSCGGPATFCDTQYFWERDVPTWSGALPDPD